MNRRTFLRRLVVGTVGATASIAAGLELDPARLLWVPGQKTFFLPSVEPVSSVTAEVWYGGRRAGKNTLLTVDLITREALKVLDGQLTFAKRINRLYDASFAANQRLRREGQQDLAFYQSDQWPRVGEARL